MASYREALDLVLKGRASFGKLETSTLDFKQDKPLKKETFQDMAEAAVCFANANGGTIVLGVADRGVGRDAFLGTSLSVDDIKERIHALTEPHLLTDVSEEEFADCRLVVIRVTPGFDVYQTTKAAPTRRMSDSCLPMSPADISRLLEERRGIDWSGQPSSRPVSEVSAVAMLRLRELLSQGSSLPLRDLAQGPTEEILKALLLTDNNGALTNAGELLLCAPTERFHELIVYQHRPTPSGEADFVRRWGAPLITAFSEVMDAIANRIGITPVTLASGQQMQIEDYPITAIREALANGLMHGEYRENRAVSIEHSPDLLSVRSPGPLVSGVLPTNILTHPSKPRFPVLAEAFRAAGLAEKLGQGVDRMFRDMIRTGKTAPKVEVTDSGTPDTVISFAGGPPNSRVAKFLASLPLHEQNDTDTLLITRMLCDRKSVTAAMVAPVIQRDIDAAESVLRRLSTGEAHLIEPTSGTAGRRHPNYSLQRSALVSLGPAVKYQKRSVQESDAKIQEHLRDYGSVNSRTVQRMFDVDVFQARNILSDLLGREVIIRISEQRRGSAVKYGPGPKFPAGRAPKPAAEPNEQGKLF